MLDDSHRVPDPLRDEIGSTSWPALGLYSSSDPALLAEHCRQMAQAGIGVGLDKRKKENMFFFFLIVCSAIVSWYGPQRADQKTSVFAGFQDKTLPLLLDAAEKEGIRIAFHHEVCVSLLFDGSVFCLISGRLSLILDEVQRAR